MSELSKNPDVFGEFADYYDKLYGDKDYLAEVAFVQELIADYFSHSPSMLDLGCGTGAHAFIFSEQGFDVVGLDRSEKMIEIAKNKCESIKRNNYPKFQQGVMQNFTLGQTFDLVVSLFHAINYSASEDELNSVFKCAREHLKKDGLFIFDSWNGDSLNTHAPQDSRKEIAQNDFLLIREGRTSHDKNLHRVTIDYSLSISKGDGRVKTLNESHTVRYLFQDEVLKLAKKNAFCCRSSGAWGTSNPITPSDRSMYFVLKAI